MNFNFFNKKETKKVENVPTIIELKEQPSSSVRLIEKVEADFFSRTKQTIKSWRDALAEAENPQNPNRYYLFNLYKDVLLDTTLQGAIQQRTERILSTDWVVENLDKTINKENNDKFHSKWFYDLLQYNIEAIFYGFTLTQIDGIDINNNISSISLIPRENIIPEYGEIKIRPQGGEAFSYRSKKYYRWLLEYMKDSKDLGLLMKLAMIVLYKKEAMKAWNRFSELYGMPIRVARTGKSNPQEKGRLLKMITGMASNGAVVLDLEDDIELISNSASGAYEVYQELISTLNKEIYKAVLGQTMSSEDSASYSQAFLHNKMFNFKAQMDLRNLQFWVNTYLIPKLTELGVIKDKINFRFIDDEKLLISERINIDTALLQFYEIDPVYIAEKYKVPVLGMRENNMGSPMKVDVKTDQKSDIKKRMK